MQRSVSEKQEKYASALMFLLTSLCSKSLKIFFFRLKWFLCAQIDNAPLLIMRIISWNINGIRSFSDDKHWMTALQHLDPDVVCVQETKVARK